jgi:hypothetical protein
MDIDASFIMYLSFVIIDLRYQTKRHNMNY